MNKEIEPMPKQKLGRQEKSKQVVSKLAVVYAENSTKPVSKQ
jgi:hypothetical protein